MVRIGRQIPHFEEVELSSITAEFSEDKRFRYLLEMSYGNSLYDTGRSKRAVVIMKNPSSADSKSADTSIRKVETYIYHHLKDVQHLSILNIFALRASDAADVNREFESLGEKAVVGPANDAAIRNITAGADYVVVAWGNRSGINEKLYAERVGRVKRLIAGAGQRKVYEVAGERETVQPLHGMMWGYDYKLVPCLKLKED
ncbi:MAG: DUF1643 domain-containing protein [Bacteroidetes bacterium]|nr:DUF1643 domain-containing protein [Bacteroidota bacterium]